MTNRKKRRKGRKVHKGPKLREAVGSKIEAPPTHDQRVQAALVRHKAGDIAYAGRVYRQVLEENPRHALALHYLGLVAQQSGYSREAIELIERSIAIDATDPRSYNHLGQIHLSLGDRAAALRYLKAALDIDPEHVDSLNNLANLLIDGEDLEGAIKLYRRVIELDGTVSHSPFNLAKALKKTRAYEEAIHWYRRAIDIDPKHYKAHHSLALTYEEMGQFDKAVEHYTQTLAINPTHVKALSNLLAIKTFQPTVRMIEFAEQLTQATQLEPADRAKLHHGLGKHYDRLGEYQRAFYHFSESCKAQQCGSQPFDGARIRNHTTQLIETFDAAYFRTVAGYGDPSEVPVFIVGMPRSGTTLTEQILASHSQVYGAGELMEIPNISRSVAPGYPQGFANISREQVAQLAQRYLQFLRELDPGPARRITDKLPMNFSNLGLIATLFPNAKIIYCRRDPMDAGLSCYIEMFKNNNDFTLNLEDFGEYFLQQERIMAHWREVLPVSIYEQKYEDLITDQETQSRKLVGFCGLPWEDACLAFHQTERAVNTPSRWQVRQPIYHSSIGRWRNYAEQMLPLERYLKDYRYC